MKLPNYLILLLAALLSVHSAVAEVPEKLESLILSKAPQIDANKDGAVTRAEVEKAYPNLPERYQSVIRKGIPDIGEGSPRSKPAPVVAGDANWLLMGHSFFKPVADGIEDHAHRAGFEDHRSVVVMSGSASGAPLSLWNNEEKRTTIQDILDAGGIETIGMTFYPYIPGRGNLSPEIEELVGYDNWINYAVESKSDLKRVFIAVSWAYIYGGKAPLEDRIKTVDRAVAKMQSHVEILREKYPDIDFQVIPYGHGAFELERLLTAGKLDGVEHLKTPDRQGLEASIYRDNGGHASPILVEASRLIWLRALYGVDLMEDYPEYGSDYDEDILKKIAMDVMAAHEEKYPMP